MQDVNLTHRIIDNLTWKKHSKKNSDSEHNDDEKKKRIDNANWKQNRKKKISTDNKCRATEKNQKNYRKEQKWNDEIKMTL